MEANHTRMCELLVGLGQVRVRRAEGVVGLPFVVDIELRTDQGWCPGCGVRAQVTDRAAVSLVDLACFGRQSAMVWFKHRWTLRWGRGFGVYLNGARPEDRGARCGDD